LLAVVVAAITVTLEFAAAVVERAECCTPLQL
jgi:hypothetical protein